MCLFRSSLLYRFFRNLKDRLEAMYVHCNAKLKKIYEAKEPLVWTAGSSDGLRLQIMSLEDEKQPVRSLMSKFLKLILSAFFYEVLIMAKELQEKGYVALCYQC